MPTVPQNIHFRQLELIIAKAEIAERDRQKGLCE